MGDAAEAGYYRPILAEIHHRGFGFHADACAPGVLALLEGVRDRNGDVLELGCGSGLLTKHLVDAGHRVTATDASESMLALAAAHAGGVDGLRRVVLPDDPLPAADAIVSVGHVLNYLPGRAAIDRALVAAADALRPGGILALDICDLEWGELRRDAPNYGGVGDGWAMVTEFSVPAPDLFVRDITAFLQGPDGTWRRDVERHENVLVDTGEIPDLLAQRGIEAEVRTSFGDEELMPGLRVVVGRRPE